MADAAEVHDLLDDVEGVVGRDRDHLAAHDLVDGHRRAGFLIRLASCHQFNAFSASFSSFGSMSGSCAAAAYSSRSVSARAPSGASKSRIRTASRMRRLVASKKRASKSATGYITEPRCRLWIAPRR